jgi:hypothetical protein
LLRGCEVNVAGTHFLNRKSVPAFVKVKKLKKGKVVAKADDSWCHEMERQEVHHLF